MWLPLPGSNWLGPAAPSMTRRLDRRRVPQREGNYADQSARDRWPVNRIQSSTSCRICRRWLEGDRPYSLALRQIENGMCDDCQRKRQAAAVEYIAACDSLRQLALFGLTGGKFDQPRMRVASAEARCVSLLMWPWTRQVIQPERFRGTPRYRERRGNRDPNSDE